MISKSTEYALKTVVFLAQNIDEDKFFGKKTLAEKLELPESYLAKVLQQLVKKEIIGSIKGPQGGFYALPETLSVSLLDIIDVFEGLEFFKKCGLGHEECDEENPCPIHKDYEVFRSNLQKTLENKTIKDVIRDLKSGKAFLKNLI